MEGVAHRKTIMQMSDADIDLDLAADAIDFLQGLR